VSPQNLDQNISRSFLIISGGQYIVDEPLRREIEKESGEERTIE
jgi:hypothetical protein